MQQRCIMIVKCTLDYYYCGHVVSESVQQQLQQSTITILEQYNVLYNGHENQHQMQAANKEYAYGQGELCPKPVFPKVAPGDTQDP